VFSSAETEASRRSIEESISVTFVSKPRTEESVVFIRISAPVNNEAISSIADFLTRSLIMITSSYALPTCCLKSTDAIALFTVSAVTPVPAFLTLTLVNVSIALTSVIPPAAIVATWSSKLLTLASRRSIEASMSVTIGSIMSVLN